MTILDLLDKSRSLLRVMFRVILPCCDRVSINSCLWFRYKWHLKRSGLHFIHHHIYNHKEEILLCFFRVKIVTERATTNSKSSMKYLHTSVACIKVFWNNYSALNNCLLKSLNVSKSCQSREGRSNHEWLQEKRIIIWLVRECVVLILFASSRKHTYIILTPLNATFI